MRSTVISAVIPLFLSDKLASKPGLRHWTFTPIYCRSIETSEGQILAGKAPSRDGIVVAERPFIHNTAWRPSDNCDNFPKRRAD